jgi:hypothetical protein
MRKYGIILRTLDEYLHILFGIWMIKVSTFALHSTNFYEFGQQLCLFNGNKEA